MKLHIYSAVADPPAQLPTSRDNWLSKHKPYPAHRIYACVDAIVAPTHQDPTRLAAYLWQQRPACLVCGRASPGRRCSKV